MVTGRRLLTTMSRCSRLAPGVEGADIVLEDWIDVPEESGSAETVGASKISEEEGSQREE
jgi:hypothetical protein